MDRWWWMLGTCGRAIVYGARCAMWWRRRRPRTAGEPVGSGLAREQVPAAGTMVPLGTEVVVRFTR